MNSKYESIIDYALNQRLQIIYDYEYRPKCKKTL